MALEFERGSWGEALVIAFTILVFAVLITFLALVLVTPIIIAGLWAAGYLGFELAVIFLLVFVIYASAT